MEIEFSLLIRPKTASLITHTITLSNFRCSFEANLKNHPQTVFFHLLLDDSILAPLKYVGIANRREAFCAL